MDNPLNAHRAEGYEKILVPEISRIIEHDNVVMAPDQGKTLVSILIDGHCEKLAFPHLFPTESLVIRQNPKFIYPLTKYFNQRLLTFRQSFASDADYIFLQDQSLSNIIEDFQ